MQDLFVAIADGVCLSIQFNNSINKAVILMSDSNSYILETGGKGRNRLAIQNELLFGPSCSVLLEAGLFENMNVLEMACGVGFMSTFIANTIGPNGKLTATDISQDQLDIAKKYCDDKGNDNIIFSQVSVLEEQKKWHNSFDMVYARLVLGHIVDPILALKNMSSYLKPGGVLVCEESVHRASFCEPDSPAFNRVFELFEQLQNHHGYVSQGNLIHNYFVHSGLSNIEVTSYISPLKAPRHRELISLGLSEVEPALLKHNIATEKEMAHLKEELAKLMKQDSFIGYLPITQIFGTK